MYEAADVLRLIEARMKELSMTQVELGLRAFGKADNTAIQSLKRGSSPGLDRAAAMARALDLECYFGPRRQVGFSEGASAHDLGRKEALRGGYLPIPWHQDAKRKGSSPVALSQRWLEGEGLIPDFLQAVVPDLMNLSFAPAKNTVAVLNTTAARKGSGGYWCFKDGTQIGIARAAFSDGLTVLLPADDAGDVRIVHKDNPGNVSFLGRVVWMGLLTSSA